MKEMKIKFHEIAVTMLIREDWYQKENLDEQEIKDRIQQGIEVPLESIEVVVNG